MSIDPGAQPGFLITMGRMYEDVTAIRGDLQKLSGSMQTLSGDVRQSLEMGRDHEDRIRRVEHDGATKEELAELEKELSPRIGALERWRWGAAGAISVVSVGGSALVGYLTAKH